MAHVGRLAVGFLFFVLLATVIQATDTKTSCVNKFTKLVTTFFTTQQVGNAADAAVAQIVKKANSSDIVSAVLNSVVKSLSASQYAKGASLALTAAGKFGSYGAINSTIQKCIDGAAPVLLKLYPKVTKKIKAKSGASDSAKMTVVYNFANKRFTQKLVRRIVKKCKTKLTADEYSKGTSLLKPYINYEALGITY